VTPLRLITITSEARKFIESLPDVLRQEIHRVIYDKKFAEAVKDASRISGKPGLILIKERFYRYEEHIFGKYTLHFERLKSGEIRIAAINFNRTQGNLN